MRIAIEPGDGAPRLRLAEPGDFKRFCVTLATPLDRAGLAAALHPLGRVQDDETCWIRTADLAALARADGLPAAWHEQLAAMVAAARDRGWVSQAGDEIQAHVERTVTEGVALEAGDFRAVLSRLATCVAVITSFDEDGRPIGMTCNAVSAASLDPPLIAVFPARSSTTWPRIRPRGRFGVNVLALGQRLLVDAFARPGDRFAGVRWQEAEPGVPLIEGSLAFVGCAVAAEHPAGDHTVVLGEARDLRCAAQARPLVLFARATGTFAA